MYPTLKIWILLEFEFNPHVFQQLIPSIKAKINLIDTRKQQSFTLAPASITPNFANTLGFIPPIWQ